jgi:hypothetical protein
MRRARVVRILFRKATRAGDRLASRLIKDLDNAH